MSWFGSFLTVPRSGNFYSLFSTMPRGQTLICIWFSSTYKTVGDRRAVKGLATGMLRERAWETILSNWGSQPSWRAAVLTQSPSGIGLGWCPHNCMKSRALLLKVPCIYWMSTRREWKDGAAFFKRSLMSSLIMWFAGGYCSVADPGLLYCLPSFSGTIMVNRPSSSRSSGLE